MAWQREYEKEHGNENIFIMGTALRYLIHSPYHDPRDLSPRSLEVRADPKT